MVSKPKLLWITDGTPPAGPRAFEGRWDVAACRADEPLEAQLPGAAVAVVCLNGSADDLGRVSDLIRRLDRWPGVKIFLLPPEARSAWERVGQQVGPYLCLSSQAPPGELEARLEGVAVLHPMFRKLQNDLTALREFHASSCEDIDEQMRLAARLQRDFLPRRMPEVGPVRFGVFCRPASWVSGDIYDVTRLDETHLGFYVADAIGHGMPAALLTMFIKRSLQTKRILGNTYQILPPETALAELNGAICEQNLSSCHFCTVAYCLLDVATLELTYSRAGHPEPILIRADRRIERLACPGSLLGVFPEEEYRSARTTLARGDRLLLYTDGAEHILQGTPDGPPMERIAAPWAGVPRDQMLLDLACRIDQLVGSSPQSDDITLLVADVE